MAEKDKLVVVVKKTDSPSVRFEKVMSALLGFGTGDSRSTRMAAKGTTERAFNLRRAKASIARQDSPEKEAMYQQVPISRLTKAELAKILSLLVERRYKFWDRQSRLPLA